jgi:FkbM family methyltransferase
MRQVHPEFTHEHDIFDDYRAVNTLLLGDFLGWQPFPGARAMDCGANAGIVSAYLGANQVFVTAYEADPVTHNLLAEMIRATRLQPYVTPIHAAIWTHTGTVPYHGNGFEGGRNGAIQIVGGGVDGTGDMTLGTFRGNTPVIHPDTPLVPCISFIDAISDTVWDFVKLDIEGAEFQTLLATPNDSLTRIGFLQIEFHNGWADDVVYAKLLGKLSHTFDHSGAVVVDGEHRGRYHYGHFRNRSRR